jgi:hypothetical protein
MVPAPSALLAGRPLVSSDTEAEIAFLEAAFDAQETPGSRMLGPDGRIGHSRSSSGTP